MFAGSFGYPVGKSGLKSSLMFFLSAKVTEAVMRSFLRMFPFSERTRALYSECPELS